MSRTHKDRHIRLYPKDRIGSSERRDYRNAKEPERLERRHVFFEGMFKTYVIAVGPGVRVRGIWRVLRRWKRHGCTIDTMMRMMAKDYVSENHGHAYVINPPTGNRVAILSRVHDQDLTWEVV